MDGIADGVEAGSPDVSDRDAVKAGSRRPRLPNRLHSLIRSVNRRLQNLTDPFTIGAARERVRTILSRSCTSGPSGSAR